MIATTDSDRLTNGTRTFYQHAAPDDWVGLGLWCRAGSRFERPGEAGWAHLLEHLWFRGGHRHDAVAVDRASDRLGGWVNAETGREMIGLWGLAPRHHAEELAALLLDMFLAPAFSDSDVTSEKNLIRDELEQRGLDPVEGALTRALARAWPASALAEPLANPDHSLDQADAERLHAWLTEHAVGPGTVATLLGDWPDHARQRIQDGLTALPSLPAPTPSPPPEPASPSREAIGAQRAALVWATPTPGYADTAYDGAALATRALGGGLSALLPARLRREAGLVYDISAHVETTLDAGAAVVQTVTSQAERTAAIVEHSLATVQARGLPISAISDAEQGDRAREALAATQPVATMRELAMGGIAGRWPSYDGLAEAARVALCHGNWTRTCQPVDG